jgi:hypothetical protein
VSQPSKAVVLQLFPDDDLVVPQPKRPHKPNPVWDTLEELFGPVEHGTRAHGKRNAAERDLRLMNATPEEMRHAVVAYNAQWPAAGCTDMALALHFPLFRPKKIEQPCSECGIGGGCHAADCVTVTSDQSAKI